MLKPVARSVVLLVATVLLGALLSVVPSGLSSPASAAPDSYTPRGGVKFNEPYGRKRDKAAIRRHIVRSLNSTVRGDKVRIASWNIRGKIYTDAMIRAHKRGVSVQVILSRGNINKEHPNPEVTAMKKLFRGDDTRRPADMQSWVKPCVSSCRGRSGIAHTKLFLFNHVTNARWVAMYGSNNATDVAVNDQWNDLFTVVNDQGVYNSFLQIFNQMSLDQPVTNPYRTFGTTGKTFFVYPYSGPVPRAQGDPDLARLNRIQCKGATNERSGRTRIRMAQDALHGERGQAIADRLVQMRKRGCDIKLIYALLGAQIRKTLVAGGVKILQYSYDRNRDGYYDIYLHMKALAVSGVYNGRTDARVVFNGTANWTSVALASDEIVGEINDPRTAGKYLQWINYLFDNRPPSWGSDNLANISYSTATSLEGRTVTDSFGRPLTEPGQKYDPYALIKREGL